MAEDSWPNENRQSGSVVEADYERLSNSWGADGLHGVPTDQPIAYANGTGTRRVFIRANRHGQIRGFHWTSGSTDVPVDLPANTGSARVDRIVLRLNRATWTARAGYIVGQSGSSQPPALTQNLADVGVFEIPWARVAVPNNAGALSAGAVTPEAWYVSDDGSVLCTAATMPPYVMPGVLLSQTDTKRGYVGVGVGATAEWRLIADSGDGAFAPGTGWTMTGGLFRRNGLVTAALTVRRTTTVIGGGATVTVGTIPSAYRPPIDISAPLVIPNSTGRDVAFGTYGAGGNVSITTPNNGGFGINATVAFGPAAWPAS